MYGRHRIVSTLAGFLVALFLAACGGGANEQTGGRTALRIGHFPNITHAQALVAHAMSRAGTGWFESRLGETVAIEWYVYNAGPTAMEALLNGSLDMTYVGPNPAINAHIQSGGKEIRVVAGSAKGGAALLVHGDGSIRTAEDFRGRKVATPQLGNTQDVAARAWLSQHGFRITQTGGDVFVIPTANPDQLTLFQRGDLDAVWTVEPWVSRLEQEAGAVIFLEQPDALTTVLATSVRFQTGHADLLAKVAAAHRELTDWIRDNPDAARRLVRDELAAETMGEIPESLVAHAWPRLRFTADVTAGEFQSFVADARTAGFMDEDADVSRLVIVP